MLTHVPPPNSGGQSSAKTTLPQSNALDALECIGAPRSFARDEEIYAEDDVSDNWYRVAGGTVRISKLLLDGRRHIAEFCFAGDCFGLDSGSQRVFSAEAVGEVALLRYSLRATERLIEEDPRLARCLCAMTLRELAHSRGRMLLLGRMTAAERVASFLLEMLKRRDQQSVFDLPMSRVDIADYLGLTVETVCRTLSAFKRTGSITVPNPHRVEVCDREALKAIAEGETCPTQPQPTMMLRDLRLPASPRASISFA